MGQAKVRGTFEQRKAEAIARVKQRESKLTAYTPTGRIRPAGKSRIGAMLAAALAIGAGSSVR